MRQFFQISLFWAAVFVAIWLLARFPESWLGRIMFARQGPLPLRGEAHSRYLMRWARYAAGWFVQAVVVLGVGWEARRLDPSLGQALFFEVFWLAVVPLLAAVALLGSLFALAASLWRRYLGAERRKRGPSHAVQA
jgi:hypothetical protein